MAEKMGLEQKKCITPEFRASYPNVLKPKAFEDGEPKYSITMLFSKKTDLTDMKKKAMNAAVEKWGAKAKDMINGKAGAFRWPFRDGDKERADQKGYKDTIFVGASAKADKPPGLVDNRNNDILNERDFYAGCYARAELIAFAYDTRGNRGVSFSLQNIQKLRDGERFGGRKDAKAVFDTVDDGSDDVDSYDDVSNEGDADAEAVGF